MRTNSSSSAPLNIGRPCPGSNTNGIPLGEFARVLQHAVAAVGRDDAELRAAASRTWFRCEWFIAPGWNAVIWLSSRSVVMKACAV
jgi:hypothetical protein